MTSGEDVVERLTPEARQALEALNFGFTDATDELMRAGLVEYEESWDQETGDDNPSWFLNEAGQRAYAALSPYRSEREG